MPISRIRLVVAVVAISCVTGCATGRKFGNFAKSLWPWGKTESSVQPKSRIASNPNPRAPLVTYPSHNATAQTLGQRNFSSASQSFAGTNSGQGGFVNPTAGPFSGAQASYNSSMTGRNPGRPAYNTIAPLYSENRGVPNNSSGQFGSQGTPAAGIDPRNENARGRDFGRGQDRSGATYQPSFNDNYNSTPLVTGASHRNASNPDSAFNGNQGGTGFGQGSGTRLGGQGSAFTPLNNAYGQSGSRVGSNNNNSLGQGASGQRFSSGSASSTVGKGGHWSESPTVGSRSGSYFDNGASESITYPNTGNLDRSLNHSSASGSTQIPASSGRANPSLQYAPGSTQPFEENQSAGKGAFPSYQKTANQTSLNAPPAPRSRTKF